MEKLSINKIPKNFFRTVHQKIETHQANPFGVSFKGSVITADVFETKKSGNLIIKALGIIKKNISRLWENGKSI